MKRFLLFGAVLALPLLSGCYDDSDVLLRLGKVEEGLKNLENKLNDELDALNDMINGTVSITECKENEDGSYDLTLSSGVSLTVKDGADLSAAVTYKVHTDGKNYWALYSEDGDTIFLTDSEGKKIPVSQPVPTVVERDGERYLVVGDVQYELGGESVFTSYAVNKNSLTGEVLSVTFGFGDDMSFTVTVDGVSMFRFIRMDRDKVEPISNYFVSYATTEMIMTEQEGVVSYIVEMPKGWEYERYTDEAGYKYLNVTAPSEDAITTGTAVPAGSLSAIAVLEGGKAMAAELYVTTDPFSDISIRYGTVDVKMNTGLMKYMYGVLDNDAVSHDAIIQKAASLLSSESQPAYGRAESDLSVELSKITDSELVAGCQYVFWAVPALCIDDSFVVASYAKVVPFVYQTVSFEIAPVESYCDVTMSLKLGGVSEWYGGLCKKDEWNISSVLTNLNAGLAAKFTDNGYEGSAFSFADNTLVSEAGESYVLWFAAQTPSGEYIQEDILCKEFTLNQITPGGTLSLVATDATCEPAKVTVPLSCEGADRIYYAFLPYSDKSRHDTAAKRVEYILANGTFGVGESLSAESSMVTLKPKTAVTLFAVAVASDGKYGNVYVQDYTTSEIPYNDWTITMENTVNKPFDVRVAFSVKKADGEVVEPSDILYWAGETSKPFWKNSTGLGRSAATAHTYMWLNAETDSRLKTMANGEVADGVLTLKELAVDTECVVVMMAKDADGVYSKAFVYTLTTLAVDFGEIVWAKNEDGTDNPKWTAMQPTASEDETSTIVWRPDEFVKPVGMRSGEMAFGFNCPDGFTAYVMYGTESYMIPKGGDEDDILYGRDRMVHMVKYIDKKVEKDLVVGVVDGVYVSEWSHFAHGYAKGGYAVVFDQSDIAEHDASCSCESNSTIERRVVYFNTETIEFKSAAVGVEDMDRVYVMYKDSEGNFYEPHYVDVPYTYYKNAPSE